MLKNFSCQMRYLIGIFLIIVVVLASIALSSWNIADPSLSHATNANIRNYLGFWGASYADLAMQFLGLSSVIALLPPFFWGILFIFKQWVDHFLYRFLSWIMSILLFAFALALLPVPPQWPILAGLGGMVGDGLYLASLSLADQIPTYMRVLIGLFVVMPIAIILSLYAGGVMNRNPYKKQFKQQQIGIKPSEKKSVDRPYQANKQQQDHQHFFLKLIKKPLFSHGFLNGNSILNKKAKIEPDLLATSESSNSLSKKGERKERAKKEQSFSQTETQNHHFILPSIRYLSTPKKIARNEIISHKILAQNAQKLTEILEDFGVKGKIINSRPGPVVTLYELEPAPGVKSLRIIGLADDIARSMSAVSARIAVIPGRNVIGIELPNQIRETVFLREILETKEFEESRTKLGLALGKTIGGEIVIADLAKMPHLLVAGTTGSGKSVAINTMILSLLYRMTPETCRFIMIDPKMLELSVYEGIPHLLTPVVTDPKKAITALKWAVREMEDRYRKMAKMSVRNIDGFNQRIDEAQQKGENLSRTVQVGFDKKTGEPLFETEEFELTSMPHIVVIIDEMADLMMVAGKEIEAAVQRLAQMARAAGIHVIMATQRPSVDVITGTIKANFPTRISFAVTSKIDSRTILGEQGAEQLLGQGDMLFMMGGGRIERIHGPFVDDQEVEQVVAHLKNQAMPYYLSEIMEEISEDTDKSKIEGMLDPDDPYEQAVQLVAKDRKVSTSYIQRRLGIGYNRAATIIERMEEAGLIGPANHAGKREIFIPEQEETL